MPGCLLALAPPRTHKINNSSRLRSIRRQANIRLRRVNTRNQDSIRQPSNNTRRPKANIRRLSSRASTRPSKDNIRKDNILQLLTARLLSWDRNNSTS